MKRRKSSLKESFFKENNESYPLFSTCYCMQCVLNLPEFWRYFEHILWWNLIVHITDFVQVQCYKPTFEVMYLIPLLQLVNKNRKEQNPWYRLFNGFTFSHTLSESWIFFCFCCCFCRMRPRDGYLAYVLTIYYSIRVRKAIGKCKIKNFPRKM